LLLLSQKATKGSEVELLDRLDNFCTGAGQFERLVKKRNTTNRTGKQSRVTEIGEDTA
jgi:hypothetical protein